MHGRTDSWEWIVAEWTFLFLIDLWSPTVNGCLCLSLFVSDNFVKFASHAVLFRILWIGEKVRKIEHKKVLIRWGFSLERIYGMQSETLWFVNVVKILWKVEIVEMELVSKTMTSPLISKQVLEWHNANRHN